MTTRDELREKVAAGLRTRLAVNVLRHAPHVGHGWINELSVALAADVLAVMRAELAEPSEAMMQRASDAIAWAYAESDWEEAKEMAEDLDPRVIYDAIFAASPLAEAMQDD